jgi:hypothetical protein
LGLSPRISGGPSAHDAEQETSQNPKKSRVGDEKARERLDSLLDLPCGSEEAVRDRILSIVDYLGQLQAK